MAYILHIDTSGDVGIVAISKAGSVVSSISNADTRNHAATINLHIEKVLQEAGITMQQLDAVAVCGGPGSYTGLRIGLATAKGICYLLDKPLMMHHKLALLALGGIYKYKTAYEVYSSILNAREGEYYFASYNNQADTLQEPQHILQADLQAIANNMAGKCLLAGDWSDTIQQVFSSQNADHEAANTVDLHTWAAYAFEQYNCNEFVNLANSEPFYLKQVYTHKPKNIS
ncbi:tRNA (adenosine(37)-N6)-threonylcarbamoyltransferase complex dimerization subunit type 1 TsaB [Chitinophagaceae bacterium IBVUCB1]|nr:tRNA (adenosine(37)-N6)-threonylcarbamoyltransferase complex dimerization subunit type 1 TsaB [Chitinophagaceae bacterium IBVUCB1]